MDTSESTAKSVYHQHYYRAHAEQLKARSRLRHHHNRDAILAKKRARYQKKRAEILAKNRLYQKTHRAEINAHKQARILTPAQQERKREWQRRYYRSHRAQVLACTREQGRKRRAARQGVAVSLTVEQWVTVLKVYKSRCAYCGKRARRLEQDHITPISKGGGHTLFNVVPACRQCNGKKGANAPLCPIQPLML